MHDLVGEIRPILYNLVIGSHGRYQAMRRPSYVYLAIFPYFEIDRLMLVK